MKIRQRRPGKLRFRSFGGNLHQNLGTARRKTIGEAQFLESQANLRRKVGQFQITIESGESDANLAGHVAQFADDFRRLGPPGVPYKSSGPEGPQIGATVGKGNFMGRVLVRNGVACIHYLLGAFQQKP